MASSWSPFREAAKASSKGPAHEKEEKEAIKTMKRKTETEYLKNERFTALTFH
jgi:hypothetical protein